MTPALPAFLARIVGARSQDPDLARRELLINAMAFGLCLMALLWFVADLLSRIIADDLVAIPWQNTISYVGLGVGTALCLLVYGLSRRGNIEIAGYLLVALLLGYTTWLTWRWGIEVADVMLYLLAIMLAGLLVGARGGLITASAAVLLYSGMGLLQQWGLHAVPLQWPILPNVVSFALVLYLAAVLNWIAHRHLTTALQEAQLQTIKLHAAREEQTELLADLQAKTERQAQLLQTVEELSAPIIVVHDQIIVLPLVGYLDEQRAEQVRQALLHGIARHRATIALIDVTGLPLMNREAVRHLETMNQAGRLLGAEVILVGIQAEAAARMIKAEVDTQRLHTHRDLQSGIEWALARMGQRIVAHG